MLEIMGEVVYKSVAYRRVADVVERYPDDVAALYRRETPPKIAGAGPALSAKLAELAETGELAYHRKLRAQVPDGLLDMLRVPGVGPRTVKLLHEELGIDSVDALRAAANELLAAPRIPRQRPKGDDSVEYDLRPLLIDITIEDGQPVAVITRTRFHPELGTGRPEEVVAALGDQAGLSLEIAAIVRDRLILAEDLG